MEVISSNILKESLPSGEISLEDISKILSNSKNNLKRPIEESENDEDDGFDDDDDFDEDDPSLSGRSGRSNFSSANEGEADGEKLDKTKERNRIHSKLTRLRKRSKINGMKDKLKTLQEENNRLERMFDEVTTAKILLCLRVDMPPDTIESITAENKSKKMSSKDIMEQLKEKVRAEAEIIRKRFEEKMSNSLSENNSVAASDSEKRERNRIHAKLTRVRRKLLANEVQEAIQNLEIKNMLMHNKLDSIIKDNLNNLNILVVDDVLSIRKTTKMMLEKSGFNVSMSQNGEEALKIMKESQFDVVLMDLQMPVMDGIEAMKFIRKKEKNNNENSETASSPKNRNNNNNNNNNQNNDNNNNQKNDNNNNNEDNNINEAKNSDINNDNNNNNHNNNPSTTTNNIDNLEPKKPTFIIALSAFSDEVTLAESYQAGADAFIAKPFNVNLFKETLQSLITLNSEQQLDEGYENN